MDKDEKLLLFLDTLGQDAEVEFAKEMLEAADWNVEAAINMVVGGGVGAPPTQNTLPADLVDEEGYRAPMRTGYTDQLLGPSPEDLVWEQAAMHAQHDAFHPRGLDEARGGQRDHHSDDVRAAMRASQQEYQRLADQQEQGMMAQALQASYTDYTAEEQRRMQQGFQEQTEEQRLIAEAIEASYREQSNADAQYHKQMERVLAESKQQVQSSASRSGRTSPTSVGSGRDLGLGGRQPAIANRSHPQSGSSLRQSRPSSGEGLIGQQPRHVAEVRAGASALSSTSTRQPRLSHGSSGGNSPGTVREAPINPMLASPANRNSDMSRYPIRSADDVSGRSVRAKTESLPSRTVNSSTRNGSSSAVGSRHAKDPMSTNSSSSSTAGATDHRPRAPGPLPSPPPPPASGSRRQTPPSLLRPGAEDIPREAKKDLPAGLRPLSQSRVMTQAQARSQAGASKESGRRPTLDERAAHVREEEERRRNVLQADSWRQRRESEELVARQTEAADREARQRREAEELAKQSAERQRRLAADQAAEDERRRREAEELAARQREADDRQRLAAEKAAEAERQRSLFAEQERQRRTSAAVAEASRLAEAEKRKQEAEAELRAKAEADQRAREEAINRRRAQEEAAANAAAEAERLKRGAAEFEAENRRREAKEAEELRREREEAEQRRREEERAKHPEEKEKEGNEFVTALVALRRQHKEAPDALATCLKTMRTYINNLAGNPHEPKFQRINTANAAFQTRVAALEGAIAVLIACGFQQEGTSLVVGEEFLKTKGPRLFDAVAKMDVVLDQLKK
mmetsp:Transcript_66899/g.105856  ORF Transcript_66899/g.105856 Transcript_66899/m.105856 type:complete len:800 (-) Transcript_66899:70-2469(-)